MRKVQIRVELVEADDEGGHVRLLGVGQLAEELLGSQGGGFQGHGTYASRHGTRNILPIYLSA